MKKAIIAVLFVLLTCTFVSAAQLSNFSASRLLNPLLISFNGDKQLSFIESEKWWLKKYNDLRSGAAYLYSPLDASKIFDGVYLRFDKNTLVMCDYVIKKDLSKKAVFNYFISLRRTGHLARYSFTNNSIAGTSSKTACAYILLYNTTPRRLIVVPRTTLETKNFKDSLLKAHMVQIQPSKASAVKKK